MSNWIRGLLIVIVVLPTVAGPLVHGQSQASRPRRAKYPNWDNLPAEIFFEDAFSQGLLGPRPERSGSDETRPPASDGVDSHATEQPPGYAWSQLISSETIEDEMKAIARRVDESLKTAGHFKGRGYQQARREFSVAAMLFAIINEYDGDVRWRKSAAVACENIARAARNAKVGTNPVYREAKQRQTDLKDLIRGSTLSGSVTSDLADWSQVCDRGPLMQRLEHSQQDELAVQLASKAAFTSQRQQLIREAELVAATAQVLASAGMEDAGDDEYRAYCQRMKQAAADMVDAVKRDDYQAARRSLGQLRKSCSDCHDLYKS